MARFYSVSFNRVTVSAVQDFFEILVAADQCIKVYEIHITQDSDAGDAASEQLSVRTSRVTGAPTSGSGGSTATARPMDQGDAAAGTTNEINNTTQLSGGTSVTLHTEAFNVMAGYHYVPVPEFRPVIRGQTRLVVDLQAAPSDALTMSGSLLFEEIG